MAAQNQCLFKVIDVADLNAERDVLIGLPVESTNKQTYHRVPIRSSSLETLDDRKVRSQFLPGTRTVVQNCRGLPRFALRFHPVFAPGIKVYDSATEDPSSASPRVNMSFGFSLYDNRNGPTPEEERIIQNIDGLSSFIRRTLMTCDKLRTTLKLGAPNMPSEQQKVLADTMDLHIVRPAVDPAQTSSMKRQRDNGEERMSSRYCYVKIVPNEPNIPEVFRTYFWTPDGKPIPHSTVMGWRNFQAIPVVEVEDVFVNKAMRSIQLKLRECIITPPQERMTRRPSLLFPTQLCDSAVHNSAEFETEVADAEGADANGAEGAEGAEGDEQAAKRRKPVQAHIESEDEDDDEDDDSVHAHQQEETVGVQCTAEATE